MTPAVIQNVKKRFSKQLHTIVRASVDYDSYHVQQTIAIAESLFNDFAESLKDS